MEYDLWLKSLKVGDKVAVCDGHRVIIETVVKITPTGRIRTSDNMVFSSAGSAIGDQSRFTPKRLRSPYSQYVIDFQKREEQKMLLRKLDDIFIGVRSRVLKAEMELTQQQVDEVGRILLNDLPF